MSDNSTGVLVQSEKKPPLLSRVAGLIAGEWRYVPIVVAIILIWLFFSVQNPAFISPRNLSNLVLQSVVTGMLALGLVPVLLIAQIDMSVAAMSAVAATIAGQLLLVDDVSVWVAIGAGLLFGGVVGFLQGRWITWTRTPAFLVTFGVSLALAALQLVLLPATGQINLYGTDITFLAGAYLPAHLSWILVAATVAGFIAFRVSTLVDARKAGLSATVMRTVAIPSIALIAGLVVAVMALNSHNGVPVALLLFIVPIVALAYVGSHTKFGLYLFATGANPSAVARAGINVDRIRITAFIICGVFAAFGGILGASRLLGVSAQSSGMGTLLLEAITAAVVGGTSLFGGRGSPWSALFGALAITSISNGIDLLGLGTEVKLATQGLVLVLATSVDSVASRIANNAE
ncbi:MAG: ABC transporter permease [Bauldia sp.]|nr:ABC transporter permease [Bauldia sp.]